MRKAFDFLTDPIEALGVAADDGRSWLIAAAMMAAAVLALSRFPVIGSLRVVDIAPGAVRGSVESEVVLAGVLLIGAPVLLFLFLRMTAGKGRLASSLAASYALLLAFMAAKHVANLALRPTFFSRLDWTVRGALLAAAAWIYYRQMRAVHGLAPRHCAAAVVLAFLFWAAPTAVLTFHIPGSLAREVYVQEMSAAMSVPLTAKPQPGGGLNAAEEYAKAAALLDPSVGKTLSNASELLDADGGWTDPAGRWSAQIARSQTALAGFRRAAALPYCDFTVGRKTFRPADRIPNLSGVVRLAKVALLEARQLTAEGRYARAVDDYVAVLATARHLARQTNYRLINTLVYRILLESSWQGLSRLLAAGGPPADADLERLLAALRALDADRPSIGGALGDEGARLRQQAAAAAPIEASVFQPSLRSGYLAGHDEVYARYAASLAAAGERNEPDVAEAFRREISDRYGSVIGGRDWATAADLCFANPDDAGRCVGAGRAMWSPSYGGVITTFYVADTALSLLETAAAIRLYERRHDGTSPVNLVQLIPDYISGLPRDPFSRFSPLRYITQSTWARSGWTLYGVGPDRKDDGGLVAYDWAAEVNWNDADIVHNPPRGDLVLRALKP